MRKNAVSFLEKDARYAEKCGDSPVPAMNYAQKCGKNCFFVKTGGSVIGQKSSNCAEECGVSSMANYAQKCGKKLSFAGPRRSETGRDPLKCAQKCGKN